VEGREETRAFGFVNGKKTIEGCKKTLGLDSESKADLIHRIHSRAVLSYAGELDFTDDLIAKLNK
jgi:hypothetical protein